MATPPRQIHVPAQTETESGIRNRTRFNPSGVEFTDWRTSASSRAAASARGEVAGGLPDGVGDESVRGFALSVVGT